MKNKLISLLFLGVQCLNGYSQGIGINPIGNLPDNSAGLDINFNDKGLLIPRVGLTGINDAATILQPANSLLIYNNGSGGLMPTGYFYNSGSTSSPVWTHLIDTKSNYAWYTSGNSSINPAINFIGTTDNNDFVIRTNNIERMRVKSNGNVGVGTNNPIQKFHISGGDLELSNGNDGFIIHPRAASNYDFLHIAPKTSGSYDWSKGIVINRSTGHVGIGTNGPMERLDIVGGGIKIHGTYGIGFNGERPYNANSLTDGAKIYYDNSYFGNNLDALVIEKNDGNDNDPDGGIVFAKKGANNVRNSVLVIRGDRKVSVNMDRPSVEFQVNGDIKLGMDTVIGTAGGFGNKLYFLGAEGTSGMWANISHNSDIIWMGRKNVAPDQSELWMYLGDNCNQYDAFVIGVGGSSCPENTVRYKFDASGNAFKPGGGSWITLSDVRLKKNVKKFSFGLNEVLKINPVIYQYNGLTEYTPDDGQEFVGIVAQELEKILPFMVKPNTDGYLTVDPSAFTYILINAIKEQQAIIEKLEMKVNELEKRLNK